jgi:CRISPR-associated endonuclease/helicase Cas3
LEEKTLRGLGALSCWGEKIRRMTRIRRAQVEANEFYERVFKIGSPYKHQLEVWERLTNNEFPLLLKAPTGSGKTEAVLAPFLNQFLERKFTIAPRLIYALPMRVLVNSIADRIRGYVKELNLNLSVEVQHGDVPNSPFFISDIVVTTLDQFLYGFARASHQVGYHIDIPAGAIASSLVVFDEAHMYRDGFTFSIMRALMEILYESKIPFVVMTATMPKSLEYSLFENIPIKDKTIASDTFDLNNSVSISLKDEPIYTKEEGVNIDEELFEKIKNKKTLIVLNRVKRAQEVYKKIKRRLGLDEDKPSDEVVLLHSRFTRNDRERHEKTALDIMKSKEGNPRIVISTQVLEAGMDFSAELLITELAPADSIVQRAGRCARRKDEKGDIIIFPTENEKGHLPYEKEHLEKTFEWLKDNHSFNIKDFKEVCFFVDILDYKADDYEARDTLVDLYECVLYADTKPNNIQLREGKPVYLVVVNLAAGEGRRKEDRIKDAIRKTRIKDNSINIDFGVAWNLFKDGVLKLRLDFDVEKGQWEPKEIKDISPFKYYAIESMDYNPEKGVVPDESPFI